MINIAICDDDNTVEQMLDKIALEQNIKINCEVFFDDFTLINNITQGICYDIIYLNLDMQIINGINITKPIRNVDISTLVIYISKNKRYLKESFTTDSFQFLTKPLNLDSFYTIFRFAYNKIQQKKEYFSYTYNKSFFKIPLNCISYFESQNRIIYIHTNKKIRDCKNNFSQSENRFYDKLNEVEKKLSYNNLKFLRIHQSYLVNFDYIKCMNFTEIQLLDGTLLQISQYKQKKVMNMFCSMAGILYND